MFAFESSNEPKETPNISKETIKGRKKKGHEKRGFNSTIILKNTDERDREIHSTNLSGNYNFHSTMKLKNTDERDLNIDM